MIRVFCFCTMVVSGIMICDATTTAETPSESISITTTIAKKSEKIIHSCALGTTKINSGASADCIYENASNGLCFHFGENKATYTGASRDCKDRGMRLASITKPHILDLLLGMIHRQNDSESENRFWVHIPNSTWTSIGNWNDTYSRYYGTCDPKYKQGINRKNCQFLMAKGNNTKLVLRLMKSDQDCNMKLKVFCQGKLLDNSTSNKPTGNHVDPTLAIIVATSVGVLLLLIILFLIIRSLRKAYTHSHERMENASKSDTSQNEERKIGNKYAVSKGHKCDTNEDNKEKEYADYAELDDGSIDLANDVDNDNDDVVKSDALPTTAHASAQESGGGEPSYFVLNKEPSVESLHTYEDCAFKGVSTASTLPMGCNYLVQNRPAGDADENVYDWPDLLQPTNNYTPKARRTQSETEPQYFSLEIEETDEAENIYDSVFPVDEPLKKPLKASRTKHLSLQRKKQKNKHQGHVKSQQTGGSRK
ncbi:uncharacterized protein LOC117103873 [Anneissia japonica]|uniref:uncharacterized protein LOC117103873 n=1 Tax=Anneissia japonica TaxID=1529436 RepID=UPI00142581CE|nr:uncharacterized protein LOC117103873 [Anneissia japonica]